MTRWLSAASLLLAATLASAQPLLQPAAPQRLAGPEPNELDAKLDSITDPLALLDLAAQASREGNVDSRGRIWQRLAKLRPHIGQYKYEMAAAFAEQDLKTFTYNALLELQALGYAHELEKDPRFAPVHNTEVWDHIVNGFKVNRDPFGEGKVAYTLPKQDLLIESLAWDPTRKRVLVGSAREGAVFVVGDGGTLQPLVKADKENGMWAVFDLVVDAERGVLWVASTAVPHYKRYNAETDLGRAGIFKFDLKTGKFLKRFLSPTVVGQSFFMSTLALAPNGTVYAADGVNNAAYAVADDQLKRVFHAPVLSGIRGMSVSGDGKVLYFSDYERGLFGYDLERNAPFEVAVPPKLALGGIDGVVWWRNQLVVVQSGMNPKRVMRLKLAPDGRSIVGVQPLEANKAPLQHPTLATRDGDRLLFIANSQKMKYDRFGLPRNADLLDGTVLYQLDLNFGESPDAKPE
jgi:sugar lactone lactonase YvrE